MGGAGSLGRMAADQEADTKVPAADRAAPRAFRRRTRISAAPGSAGAAGVTIDWRGGDFAHLPIYGGDGDPGGWPPLGPRGGVVARGSVPVPFVQRMPASGGGCGCGSVARPDEECEACRAQPVAGLSVQRAPAATATEPAIAPSAAPNWLVEDSGPSPAPGQATKSQWLTALREAICARADRELAGTRQSSQGCPLIAFWIGYFAGRDAAEVSAAAVRYAPELARVSNARDAIPPIVARVGEAVRVWVKTGKVTGIPAGAAALGGAGSAGAAPADAGVQRKPLAEGTSTAGQPNPAALLHRLGPGQPLDSGVRSRMEPALGQDLSAVRLHVDREAASMSSGLDARAFTVGNHIALAPGEYQPGTIAGDALLAHELAHVIQQSGAAPAAAPLRDGSPAYDALEEAADHSAAGVLAYLWGQSKSAARRLLRSAPGLRAAVGVQRCRRTVHECPRGKSWQVIGQPAGVGPTCVCAWQCMPGEGGKYVHSDLDTGPSISCAPGTCAPPPDIEIIPDDKVIRDPSGDIRLGLGGHTTPLDGQAMCGCLPLDIEGHPEGTERSDAPMLPTGLEATDLMPGRAAKAIGQLEGKSSGGPMPDELPGRKAPMRQEPPAPTPDVRPAATDVKPPAPDVKPAATDVKPPTPNVKPAATDVKPPASDVRPAATDVKPPAPVQQAGEPKPAQPPKQEAEPRKSDTGTKEPVQPAPSEKKPETPGETTPTAPARMDTAKRLAEINTRLAEIDRQMREVDQKRVDALERARDAEKAGKPDNARRNYESAEKWKDERERLRIEKNRLADERAAIAPSVKPPQTWQEAEAALRAEFSGRKKTFILPGGNRDVDCFSDDGMSREAKFGPQGLSEARIQVEIGKDVELLRTGAVKGVEWHFYENAKGKVGPSQPLRDALRKAGIRIVMH
jgi:Domain of unknown function (DUF4157)